MTLQRFPHNELAEKVKGSKALVLKFTAAWCGPCKAYAPTVEEVAGEFPDVEFIEVDIDQDQATAAQWRVRSIPMTMGFKEGIAIFQAPGLMPKSELKKKVQLL